MINHFLITTILLIYFIVLITRKKCSISCYKLLDRYDSIYVVSFLIYAEPGYRDMLILEAGLCQLGYPSLEDVVFINIDKVHLSFLYFHHG